MKRSKIFTAGASVALLAATLAACGSDADSSDGAKMTTVKTVSLGLSSDAGLYLADDLGYFKDEGITIDDSLAKAGADQIALLGTGQIDVAGGGLSAGYFNAVSSGVKATIVASRGYLSPATDYVKMILRPDLTKEITTLADLKGKKVALTAPSGGQTAILGKGLEDSGLSLDDLDLVYMPYADMGPALENKSIDAGMVAEPFITTFEKAGIATPWIGGQEMIPNGEVSFLYYSEQFMENASLATRFMTAYLKGARDYNDVFITKRASAEKTDAVIKVLIEHTATKDPEVWKQMIPSGVRPNADLNVETLQQEYDWFEDNGFLEGEQIDDVGSLVDLSFAEAAVKKLGEYDSPL